MTNITVAEAVKRLQDECKKYKSCAKDCPYFDRENTICLIGYPEDMVVEVEDE